MEYIDGAMDSETLIGLKKSIMPSFDYDEGSEEQKAIDFIQDLFSAIYMMYKSKYDLGDGESVFNPTLIYPFLVDVAAANSSGCSFVPEIDDKTTGINWKASGCQISIQS
ncbi:unnamed protein product [Absidia cylindrospora]